MGSGSNTTTTNQTQQYTPAPQIGHAGTQAISGAETASQAPFQMPVAPVAGFNPYQSLGFGETLNLQGMAQPYFNTAGNYLAGSAAPITGADVSQYYNPMAANVTAQMQNIFGKQMRETTGSATQQAGGVGADRIAVAQADLANQQGLAAGQTYSQLYQQALQAAEQQKQMMAGAGYGIGQMGPAAQAAQANAINQLLGVGAQQQGLSQQQLNAIYQNQLAGIAYPFQTAQYLAGITGGLAPAMGGTTTGTATTQGPQPSLLSQILGGATAGVGALGSAGAFGTSPTATAADAYNTGQTQALSDWGNYFGTQNRGGRINPFQGGGKVIDIRPNLEPSDLRTALERSMNLTRGAGASGFQDADPNAVAKGVMSGNVHVLRPEGRADGGSLGDYGMLADRARLHEFGPMTSAAMQGNPLAEEVAHDVGYAQGGMPMMPPQAMTGAAPMAQGAPFMGGLPTPPQPGMPPQGMMPPGAMPFGSTSFSPRGFDDGGEVQQGPMFPGSSPPPIGGKTPIPSMQLQPGAGKSGPWGQWIMGLGQHQGSGQSSGSGSGVSQAIGMAANILPMMAMLKAGGQVTALNAPVKDLLDEVEETNDAPRVPLPRPRPHVVEGYQDAGFVLPPDPAVDPTPAMQSPVPFLPKTQDRFAEDVPMPRARPPEASANPFGAKSVKTTTMPAADVPGDLMPGDVSTSEAGVMPGDAGVMPGRAAIGPNDGPTDPRAAALANQIRRNLTGGAYQGPRGENFQGMEAAVGPRPYPGAAQQDWGTRAARSPWMSLVAAGARMMQTPGNIGTAIGAGLQAGAAELGGQRKALQTEEDINQKASHLEEIAAYHLAQAEAKEKDVERKSDLAAIKERLSQQAGDYGKPPTYQDARKEFYAELKDNPALQMKSNNDPTFAGQDIQRRYEDSLRGYQAAQGKGPTVTPAGGGPLPLPATKADLKDGQLYSTSRGPAKWNAQKGSFETT